MDYDKKYWEDFYKEVRMLNEPSPFALFCRGFMDKGDSLLDLGCGNGRDARYFDSEGMYVTGLDIINNKFDFFYMRQDLQEKPDMFRLNRHFDFVYCRFLLHAVPEDIEDYIIEETHKILEVDGMFCIECRSDKGSQPIGHYRRLINMDDLIKKLSMFKIIYKIEQKGLSVYKHEDPVLIRIICKR